MFSFFKTKKQKPKYGYIPDYRHYRCISEDLMTTFGTQNPDFKVSELIRLWNRSGYLDDMNVDYSYVGTRIFITGLGFDDEYRDYDHEAHRHE